MGRCFTHDVRSGTEATHAPIAARRCSMRVNRDVPSISGIFGEYSIYTRMGESGFARNASREAASGTLAGLPVGAAYARIGSDLVNFQCSLPLVPDPDVAASIISDSRRLYYEQSAPPSLPARPARIIETLE